MNDHPERPFLYISPLTEIYDRLDGKGRYEGQGTIKHFHVPSARNHAGTKLQNIKELMRWGVNIKSTHALFMRFDNDIIDLANDYDLIIDEAIALIVVLASNLRNKTGDSEDCFQYLTQPLRTDDFEWLRRNGNIIVDENNYNQIVWVKDAEDLAHRYRDLERMIKSGAISATTPDLTARDCYIIWSLPIDILDAFHSVTILTYRFNSSILKGYLDFHHRPYIHKTIIRDGTQSCIADFSPEIEYGAKYADKIQICSAANLNMIGTKTKTVTNNPLSSRWYYNHKGQLSQMRDNLTNYLRSYTKADRDDVMWCTFKAYKKWLSPRNYTYRSYKSAKDANKNEETFVPLNCNATEHYANCRYLAYLIDRYLHPGIERFLGLRGIHIDEREYALSELIQWIWRSAIRNGETVSLYIPSARTRGLLKKWLCLPCGMDAPGEKPVRKEQDDAR